MILYLLELAWLTGYFFSYYREEVTRYFMFIGLAGFSGYLINSVEKA